eukprot:13261543-Ditylum_brightwellii.AAC.1
MQNEGQGKVEADALGIVFAYMKNDQEEYCKRVPRHMYVNSFNLQLCPLGLLAQYFLIFPAVLMDHNGLLFLGQIRVTDF